MIKKSGFFLGGTGKDVNLQTENSIYHRITNKLT